METRKKRRKIIDNCIRVIDKFNLKIDLPKSQQGIDTWKEFQRNLLENN